MVHLARLERLPHRLDHVGSGSAGTRRGRARRGGPGSPVPGAPARCRRRARSRRVAEWCGANHGGRRSSPLPSGRVPATEWSAVTSSACSIVRSGRIEGIRSAIEVLPGAPRPDEHRRVSARRGDLDGVADVLEAVEVAQVEVGQPVLTAPGRERARRGRRPRGRASGTSTPRRTADTWASERTPNTVMPGTSAASAACGSGTNTLVMPCAARGDHHRQHAGHRPQAARDRQLTDERPALEQVGR